ncbi:CDP-alcohol phosphatidyltransferase family protein [Corynebacterium sp. MC-04]|uniref:CDP-alcohol phosphatidyltransferase family protein n=1 Tax=Corynebacterium parakroppenstedtii TaxID=2828363 RepID=A0ABS9HJR8_9CORY|nr:MULTISPECIES: CDP-alcohol phosphatidyltransferase family protein [Corynebacterium]MDU3197831.1 CDP-alcohol phosphatidyltransferase family protein [Corynebacterium kroppenstedtii]MCF6768637.1 CDP-alcohol phosphatidyltransferase family protein [Corynebacterium parakroppenstedtii]MCF6771503.1 CDP-alcohol phosphatidyltransferase family protein [Corynebacterium parakroppenstedtii]MCF6773596.1 CDP-alcohol phosphatidyltransferase family protein [Corynebacterium parakroppenstedtii]MCF6778055.1 CDP-
MSKVTRETRLRVEARMDKMLPTPDGHTARAVPPGMEPPGMREQVTVHPAGYSRILTVPNILSIVRICLVPIYAWFLIGPGEYGWALAIVAISSFTDWLDGKIARIWGLTTRIGQYLDPAADRLFILVTPICFAIAGLLSWWWVAVLFARDLILFPTMLIYRNRGIRPKVMYLGKAATFALMWAFPLYLASAAAWSFSHFFTPWARALFLWGTVLYLWTGVLYLYRAVLVSRRFPVTRGRNRPTGSS